MENNMKIFKQEIADGLEEKLSTSACVSYSALVEPCSNKSNIRHIKSLASYEDSDLYYVQSILVSSNWNKNDDIFDKSEVWSARATPEDKPTNLDHDEKTIIGHIVSNWPITEDGILIDDNTPVENLPEKFHILTGSVIYKSFTIPELQERAQKLISEIESGNKYVSMECFFKGFDYGLVDKSTGNYHVLARNDKTAYLTKYLRSYGGLGEHENYKIGRVLRNITFSGKGFVDKPANPDSIIFAEPIFSQNKDKKNTNLDTSGVSYIQSNLNVEKNIMNFEQEISDLKQKIEAMQNAPELVKEAYVAASALKDKTLELENTIKAKESTIAEVQANLDAVTLEKEEAAKKMDEEMKKKEEEMKKVKSELDAANEVIAGYKMQEDAMKKKEKKMARKAALLDKGIESEVAEATVEKFDELSDDAFDAVTSLWAAKMPPWMNKEEDKKKKEKMKASESTDPVDETVLENVDETEEVDLGVGETEDNSSAETTRAALIEFVYNRLGKQLNKGE
jgi:hypothetical protein